MSEETLRVLEYDKVIALLAGMTVTVPGREEVEALRPLESPQAAAEALAEVSEAAALLQRSGAPPLGSLRDLRPALHLLQAEGTWLQPEALLEVFSSAEAAAACRSYFTGRDEAPLLGAFAGGLAGLRGLRLSIRQAIGTRGQILDSASFELGEVRREILALRQRIKRSLEDLLGSEGLAGVFQERLITERGGRYVVPVRADHRGRIKGFIHDESSSGQTLYLEPVSVLEWNNELQALLRQEKREEESILRRLSGEVRQASEALAANQRIIARLDARAAAGRFSRLSEGVAPLLADDPVIELHRARHPLLLFNADGSAREKEAVPVDLLLGPQVEALVVSGPNTGGKTVALKTIGLLLLMVRSGLHIPCAPGSRVSLFGSIFADIGDEQSIEEDLSTFSGHLKRLGRILREADGRSLVLLDEVGTGTDPAEGGALAMAVLDTLRMRGARVVVTTHLNLVKGYAHLQGGVENAAVEFDRQTLAPTYRLHYGVPGASSAFTIARRLGLPEEVLELAGSYLGQEERDGLQLLERLNRMRVDLQRELDEARTLRRRAQQERQRRKDLLDELEGQKKKILDKATRRGQKLVVEAEQRLKELLQSAGTASPDTRKRAEIGGELRAVQQELSAGRTEPPRRGQAPKEVAAGEILKVPSLGAEGEVVVAAGWKVELLVHGKKLRVPLEQLEQFSPRRFRQKPGGGKVRSAVVREGFNPTLKLVGKRADEALALLERFIDDALLQGQRQLEVVHGSGEGVLRKLVRDFLAGHREVKTFHAADIAFGGDNVTVVELKD